MVMTIPSNRVTPKPSLGGEGLGESRRVSQDLGFELVRPDQEIVSGTPMMRVAAAMPIQGSAAAVRRNPLLQVSVRPPP